MRSRKIESKFQLYKNARLVILLALIILISTVLLACNTTKDTSIDIHDVNLDEDSIVISVRNNNKDDFDLETFEQQKAIYMPYVYDGGNGYVLDKFYPKTQDYQFSTFEKQYSLNNNGEYDFRVGVDQILLSFNWDSYNLHSTLYAFAYRSWMEAIDTSFVDQDGVSHTNHNYFSSARTWASFSNDYSSGFPVSRTGPFNNQYSMGIGGGGFVDNSRWFDRDAYNRGVFERNDNSGMTYLNMQYNYSDDINKFGDELKGRTYQYGFAVFTYDRITDMSNIYNLDRLKFTHTFSFDTFDEINGKLNTSYKTRNTINLETSFDLV